MLLNTLIKQTEPLRVADTPIVGSSPVCTHDMRTPHALWRNLRHVGHTEGITQQGQIEVNPWFSTRFLVKMTRRPKLMPYIWAGHGLWGLKPHHARDLRTVQ